MGPGEDRGRQPRSPRGSGEDRAGADGASPANAHNRFHIGCCDGEPKVGPSPQAQGRTLEEVRAESARNAQKMKKR